MSTDLKAGLVRICHPDGKTTVGAGFVVAAEGLIATCAHVVISAGVGPGGTVRLVFHATGEEDQAQVESAWWRDPEADDVAILRLEGPLPASVVPLLLSQSTTAVGHTFSTFGFPQAKPEEGLAGQCEVIGRTTENGCPVLQLRSSEIRPGFSGAPVWDERRQVVIGMVVSILRSDVDRPATETAFIIPSETLRQVCPNLRLTSIADPRYERLRQRTYCYPSSVFDWARLDWFTGREWLLAKIEDFLRDKDRGYFILKAKAGLGKTTFLAHLVQTRKYVHHFFDRTSGQTSLASGLRNLAGQLAMVWELESDLAEAADRPDAFYELLSQATQKRKQIRPDEKIVVVVDALDDASPAQGQNVLGLSHLPEGIYFIVSQRPVELLLVEEPCQVWELKAEQPANEADIRAYLAKSAKRSSVAQALAEGGYTTEAFVDVLLHKSEGSFLYLRYVVDEIEKRKHFPLNLEILPNGLWQYYAREWTRWRDQDDRSWNEVYCPLLVTLAAAQEAVPLTFLKACTGVSDGSELPRLLDRSWYPFLTPADQEGERCYRFHHTCLRQFFAGQVERNNLSAQENDFVDELDEATQQAHSNIADFYLSRWGGMESKLRKLQRLTDPEFLDRYGLSHLVAHLESAGRIDEIFRLLSMEWSEQKEIKVSDQPRGLRKWLNRLLKRVEAPVVEIRYQNSWYTAKEHIGDIAGYRTDVENAKLIVEQIGLQSPVTIGYQCRYALILASLNSLSENIPPALLAQLVEYGPWPYFRGLTYARRRPEPKQRVESLFNLISCLPASQKEQILQEALDEAQTIKDVSDRRKCLEDFIPQLAKQGYWQEALNATLLMKDAYNDPGYKLTQLAYQLAEMGRPREALEVVQKIDRSWRRRGEILAELAASHLPEASLSEALKAADSIPSETERVELLIGLIPRLAEPEQGQALYKALRAAQEINRQSWGVGAAELLLKLVPLLPESERNQVFLEALDAVQKIKIRYPIYSGYLRQKFTK